MSLADVPSNLLRKYGADCTLRRSTKAAGPNAWTDGAETITYYPQRWNERISEPNAVAGAVRDPGARAVFSREYTEPKVGDRFAQGTLSSDAGAEWREITHVHPVIISGVISRYVVHYRK